MKIKIALAANFGTDYTVWQERMQKTKNFGEIKRLDDNKMVAIDTAGNTMESYTIQEGELDKKNKTDTLDGEQSGAPSDKTENDTTIGDPMLEKLGNKE